MKVLELFAGTRSIGKAFEARGHEVFSVEWDKKFDNIDLYKDIGELTAKEIIEKFGYPDVCWLSFDCTSYSISAISHHRRKNEVTGNLDPVSDYAKFCDKVNQHCLELLKELNPKVYFIENPRGGLRKMTWMQDIPRYTVTYCQYNNPLVQGLIFNMEKKKCPKCGQIKDIGEFYKNKSRRDGFSVYCKDCITNNSKEVSDKLITLELEDFLLKEQDGKCAYCNCDLNESGKQLDYIIPPSRGGKHIVNNLQWICPTCASSKGNKLENEWLKKERCKPTDIWTNHPNPDFLPMCKNGDSCHEPAPRGSKTGTQGLKGSVERARIPQKLCEHIVDICEEIVDL